MKKLIALFDDRATAVQAQQDLVRSGFAAGEVQVLDRQLKTRDEEKGFWDSLGDLFGTEDYDVYEEAARRGGTLLTVNVAEERADAAIAILRRHNPMDVDRRAHEWKTAGWNRPTRTEAPFPRRTTRPAAATKKQRTAAEGETLPVAQERLVIGKREQDLGGVRIYTHVEEVPVEKDITLRETHAEVERRAADRPAGEDAFKERSIEVHESREVPVVNKEARVVEDVVVKKEAEQHTEKVKDTLRKTEVEVDRSGRT